MNSMTQALRALTIAAVPAHLHAEALTCMAEAQARSRGLLAHKLRARLAAARIARALPWAAEQVEDWLPEMAAYGVVPNLGNGVNGDNVPWAEVYRMPDGSERELPHWGMPRQNAAAHPLWAEAQADLRAWRQAILADGGQWVRSAPCTTPLELDTDPASLSYRSACARNYWGHRFASGGAGKHPRSVEARTAWLRSNGGEREAWNRGMAVDGPIQRWEGQQGRLRVVVLRQGGVWQVNVKRRLLGRIVLHWRLGFEIDNAEHAHPRPGYERRACVTWGWRPERGRDGEV